MAVLLSLVSAEETHAAVAQWNFDGDLASAVGGEPLRLRFAKPAEAPEVRFARSRIGGELANVVRFGRGTAFAMPHGLRPNGGGTLLNRYTLIMDVKLDTSTRWVALLQANGRNRNDADWGVTRKRYLGTARGYGGSIVYGRWMRLALVVDTTKRRLYGYINGERAHGRRNVLRDGRWSIEPLALLFADQNGENGSGVIASVQLRDEALSRREIAALGGPSADGIPLPPPPEVRLLRPAGDEPLTAGEVVDVHWLAVDFGGEVELALLKDGRRVRTIGRAPMKGATFRWRVHAFLEDGDDYRLELSWRAADGSRQAARSQPLSIRDGQPPRHPLFEQELLRNGGFESGLDGWEAIEGNPEARTQAKPDVEPHQGQRFLFAGKGSLRLRQDIDLVARGFPPGELDAGAALAVEGHLRSYLNPGAFDDQAYLRVVYLGDQERILGEARSLVVGDDTWVRRPVTGLLPRGTRKLRVEVVGTFRRGAVNDAMADGLSLRLLPDWPRDATRITKGPVLTGVRPDAMTILWETNTGHVEHRVEWGDRALDHLTSRITTVQIDAERFVHRALLTPLERGLGYRYRVVSGRAATPEHHFRATPPPQTLHRIGFFADNQAGRRTFTKVLKRLAKERPNLILSAGDIVHDGADIDRWGKQWFAPFATSGVGPTVPVVFARGNHDGEHPFAYAYSELPGNGAWFSFDYGGARILFLDTQAPPHLSRKQTRWLERELQSPAAKAASLRVVVLHKGPYSVVWHRSNGYVGERWVRKHWTPLFEEHRVDLVVAGHAHAYHRFRRDGLTYVVIGGAGGQLDRKRTGEVNGMKSLEIENHYAVMTLRGRTLDWKTYSLGGSVLDSFRLVGRKPKSSDLVGAGQ